MHNEIVPFLRPAFIEFCFIIYFRKPKKKTALRRNTKLRNTKSPLQSEIDVPFKKLDSINISGELLDRGKLKWNKRIVAISNGHMLVYKPEKGARPCLVIPLAGYEATVYEREGRRGCEVRMEHTDGESHTFCLDLKEWAQIWTEVSGCFSMMFLCRLSVTVVCYYSHPNRPPLLPIPKHSLSVSLKTCHSHMTKFPFLAKD